MKVLFVHPAHPNQFTRTAYALARRKGWECAFLVNALMAPAIRREDPPIPFYGFSEEAKPGEEVSFYNRGFEQATRRGKVVMDCVAHLRESVGCDLVVGHSAFGVTFFLRKILDLPVVSYVELPGYSGTFSRPEYPGSHSHKLIQASFRALIHESVLFSDLSIAPTRYIKGFLPPELQPKVRVRMEGFKLPPLVDDRAALKRELGLHGNRPVVGFAARTLESVRGFDVFVRAVKKIRRARRDVELLVIGDAKTLYGNETAYLKGRSFKDKVLETEGLSEGELRFLPFQPYEKFVRDLQAMDLVLFPIFEGGANWGVFEAMAAGRAVLASNRCFLPEVIAHGRNGLLCDSLDADAFADAALAALADPQRCRHLGRNARRTIARRFSEEAAAAGYAAILREAAERARASRKAA